MSLTLSDSSASPRRGLAISSLVIGLLAIPTFGLLVVGGITAVVLGVIALLKIKKQPSEYGGTGFAIGGIVAGAISLALLPVFGLIAAIAIPSLSRAAIAANEASAIGRLRTIVSAEMAYAALNGGAYDTLECLAAPSACGFDGSVPSFVSADVIAPSASAYRFTFLHGPTADRSVAPGIVSASSLEGFAVIAEPEGGPAGARVFCVDDTGVVRIGPESGAALAAAGGACPANWPTRE